MLLVFLAVLAIVLLVPLALLIASSLAGPPGELFGFERYAMAWKTPGSLEALFNALAFGAGAAVVALVVGTSAAWLCERTDLPGARLLRVAMVVPLFVPGVLFAYAWILLASPRVGMLNMAASWLMAVTRPPFDVYGFAGMVWVEGLHASPMVFLLVSALCRTLDPAQEQAAQVAGARLPRILLRITLPVLAPAMGSAFLLVLIRAVGSFEVPAMLGLPAGIDVVSSRIYRALQETPGDTGPAGAYASGLLLLTVAAMGLHEWLVRRHAPATGTDGPRRRGTRLGLGRARLPVGAAAALLALATAGLPLAALAWSSLLPYYSAPDAESIGRITLDGYRAVMQSGPVADAARQTLVLCACAASMIIAAGLAAGWVLERTRLPGRRWLEPLLNSVLALPGIVLGVALLVFHVAAGTGLYGTSSLLLLAYTTRFLPYGLRYGRAALARVPAELEHAARVCGATPWQAFVRVTLPLLAPGLLAGWIYVAIAAARELSSALLLYAPGSEVLAVMIWQFWENGQTMHLSALSVLFVAVLLGLAALARWMAHRSGAIQP